MLKRLYNKMFKNPTTIAEPTQTGTKPPFLVNQSVMFLFYPQVFLQGSRDGAVVRALASHQCGPGSIPGLGVICGLSLLLVLVFAPRGFSPLTLVSLSSKTNISKFPFDLKVSQLVLCAKYIDT